MTDGPPKARPYVLLKILKLKYENLQYFFEMYYAYFPSFTVFILATYVNLHAKERYIVNNWPKIYI